MVRWRKEAFYLWHFRFGLCFRRLVFKFCLAFKLSPSCFKVLLQIILQIPIFKNSDTEYFNSQFLLLLKHQWVAAALEKYKLSEELKKQLSSSGKLEHWEFGIPNLVYEWPKGAGKSERHTTSTNAKRCDFNASYGLADTDCRITHDVFNATTEY